MEYYFEAMLRVQTRLIKWRGFTVQALYDMLMDKAQEKMRAIRKKIVSDMKAIGLVRKSSLERVQSQDDYSLITSAGYSGRSLLATKCTQSQLSYHRGPTSHANQLMKSGTSCLTDGLRYE